MNSTPNQRCPVKLRLAGFIGATTAQVFFPTKVQAKLEKGHLKDAHYQFQKKILTRRTCNRRVTHYASPIGYIFPRSCISGARRSYSQGRARLVAKGKPAGRTD